MPEVLLNVAVFVSSGGMFDTQIQILFIGLVRQNIMKRGP
jgi:hypothetical protein